MCSLCQSDLEGHCTCECLRVTSYRVLTFDHPLCISECVIANVLRCKQVCTRSQSRRLRSWRKKKRGLAMTVWVGWWTTLILHHLDTATRTDGLRASHALEPRLRATALAWCRDCQWRQHTVTWPVASSLPRSPWLRLQLLWRHRDVNVDSERL